MSIEVEDKVNRFELELLELTNAITDKEAKRVKVLTAADMLSRSEEGLQYLYDQIEAICNAGIFVGTSWQIPNDLQATLVRGTLLGGFPMVVYETLSELRIMKIAKNEWEIANYPSSLAQDFLNDAIVSSFDLAYGGSTEESRSTDSPVEQKRLRLLFDLLLTGVSKDALTSKLSKEISFIAAQRPIQTKPIEQMISLVQNNIELSSSKEDEIVLRKYVDALFNPSEHGRNISADEYLSFCKTCSKEGLKEEGMQMSQNMHKTGLVSTHQVVLMRFLATNYPELLEHTLDLSGHGRVEFERHQTFVCEMVDQFLHPENKQVAYGLSKVLNRNLLSRKSLWNAINKVFRIQLHPVVRKRLERAKPEANFTAEQWLSGGVINLLGQPLGVGQGNNPTCQSARGLSMWSRHSPEKLLNIISLAASGNTLSFRYEGTLITTDKSTVSDTFDYKLDPVSLALVPLLDDVYQKMMQKAMFKHPSEDPHVSVNPAFYGHWIQTGFKSCYSALYNAVVSFPDFLRTFYAAFHPLFNNGNGIIYPNPLGIFITNSKAEFLGFHAVSLLRVKQDKKGTWRAYFFNPNNEGRQNWGQGITPSVDGNGENHGESSLPFYQFAARVYAFHFNSMEVEVYMDNVDQAEISKVENLARQSWGLKYTWL